MENKIVDNKLLALLLTIDDVGIKFRVNEKFITVGSLSIGKSEMLTNQTLLMLMDYIYHVENLKMGCLEPTFKSYLNDLKTDNCFRLTSIETLSK